MADWYKDWMHPYTDRATFVAYQDAAKRIHYRRSPTDQDYAMVALYEALETNASLVQQMALSASQLPVRATSRPVVRRNQ